MLLVGRWEEHLAYKNLTQRTRLF